jgi:hypothetical protein
MYACTYACPSCLRNLQQTSRGSGQPTRIVQADMPHTYYEGRIQYDRSLARAPALSLQRRRRRELVESSWGQTFTPPSFPPQWKAGKRHRDASVAVGARADAESRAGDAIDVCYGHFLTEGLNLPKEDLRACER